MVKVFYADKSDFAEPTKEDICSFIRSVARREYLFSISNEKSLKQSYCLWLLVQKVCDGYNVDSSAFKQCENGNWGLPGSEYRFSFSHSGDLVVFAFSDKEVGVDAELISDRILRLRDRIENNKELVSDARTLTKNWTEKESEYKRGKIGLFCGQTLFDKQQREYYVSVCAEEQDVEFIKTEL